jgi:hypothetical protein
MLSILLEILILHNSVLGLRGNSLLSLLFPSLGLFSIADYTWRSWSKVTTQMLRYILRGAFLFFMLISSLLILVIISLLVITNPLIRAAPARILRH